jgi:hypothetical protein
MLVLERMGLTPADLLATPAARPAAPTFAEYIPVVSALVSDGCRKAYGSYWNLSRSKIVNRSWWRLVATKLVRVPSWAGWRGGYGGRGAGGVRECAARPPCRAAAFSA